MVVAVPVVVATAAAAAITAIGRPLVLAAVIAPPVPVAGKIAATAVALIAAIPSVRAARAAGAAAAATTEATASEAAFFQLGCGSLEHLRASVACTSGLAQIAAPVAGPTHPFHHLHQVAGDGP